MTAGAASLAVQEEWGSDLCIVSACDFHYLPGVYGLFNSAVMNGFRGSFKILWRKGDTAPSLPSHPQLSVHEYEWFDGNYHFNVQRINAFVSLPPGKYLFLDGDMIVERPLGLLVEPIEEGLLLSSEPEPKYDLTDALVYRQCKETGLSTDLQPFPYVNGGLLGFSLPRDLEFMEDWRDLARDHLRGITRVCADPRWFFLDQDILNLLVRQPGCKAFTISPRQLDFSTFNSFFVDRPFPHSRQGDLRPADRVKYLIHGASLRRPWMRRAAGGNLKESLVTLLEPSGISALLRGPHAYERAWAYYSCSDDRPIPVSAWAQQHGFTAYKKPVWRMAYGLA